MNTLKYKIESTFDIETISDELAGFCAAIRVTPKATVEIEFEQEVDEETAQRVNALLHPMGLHALNENADLAD